MADCAALAFERVTVHLSRLVGLTGIKTLFHRSLVLSSRTFPWLVDAAGGSGGDDPFGALRARMADQDPDAVADAFILVLSTFVGLLGRLIGEALVLQLLHEVWPAVVPDGVKESS
ncbi:MAG: hypothetical protein M3680_22300 [Myxococcota bacterium]|nr:hypothetical protein [Myxococcota bacterium]